MSLNWSVGKKMYLENLGVFNLQKVAFEAEKLRFCKR